MAFWDKQAKQWEYLGPPLKPSHADIQVISSRIKQAYLINNKLSVLLLGVTPEIAAIPWPKNTELFAIDNNLSMLKSVLPIVTPILKPLGIAGNWQQLPFSANSFDLVIGDRCPSLRYTPIDKEITYEHDDSTSKTATGPCFNL